LNCRGESRRSRLDSWVGCIGKLWEKIPTSRERRSREREGRRPGNVVHGVGHSQVMPAGDLGTSGLGSWRPQGSTLRVASTRSREVPSYRHFGTSGLEGWDPEDIVTLVARSR
jgi:hypothetical protein